MPTLKIAFFGTPDFAVPALEKLIQKHQVVAVITQPDRPAGRGLELKASAVKLCAIKHDIPCYQPQSLKKEEICLNDIDAIVCVAYGKIIPEKYLNICKSGIINIHPSLLPRWRGAAPLQWSIFSGDEKTGVCLMKLDQGLDTGDIFICKDYQIQPDETLGSLHDNLAQLGAEVLINSIEDIASEKIMAVKQSENNATYAEKWEKEDSRINWHELSSTSERRIRASNPIPGSYFEYQDKVIKVFNAKTANNLGYSSMKPGQIVAINREEIIVSCANNTHLAIREMQLAGKKRLLVSEILKGNAFKIGDEFN